MRILLLVAVICLVIALLGAASVLSGVNTGAWFIGGVLAFVTDSAVVGSYGANWQVGRRN